MLADSIARMKITDVRCILLTAPYGAGHRQTNRSYATIAIETEDGRVGLGEPYAGVNMPTVCRELILQLKPVLIGQNAESHRATLAKLSSICEYFDHRGLIYCVLGAIDWALHDLAAQRANLPLHRYLNLDSSPSVELYASAGPADDPPHQIAQDIESYKTQGFQSVKIRAGCGKYTAEQAADHIEAVKKLVPDELQLGVDTGQQIFHHDRLWSKQNAISLVTRLANLNLLFLEDPLLIHDMAGYQELAQLEALPIAGGEMFCESEPFITYMQANALDVVQPDAAVLAGPAAAIKIGQHAEKFRKKVIMHGWAGPVAQMQNIHAALAIGVCDMVEYCVLYHPLLHEVLSPIWQFESGRLQAPEQPGMGIAFTDHLITRYPFTGVSHLIA
ncbi:mandelate racemase/muconate lactonizing enzyme family protein [Poriferisphaera sp. WC338]|uniref:mandelate racemase/muconate lactonizing enzyme family protein n=1 Tax=Poriferisphaera sp. WC338 TaxID=3425129 RepID=UPI003D81BA29